MEVFLKTSLIITQAQGTFIAEMRVKRFAVSYTLIFCILNKTMTATE